MAQCPGLADPSAQDANLQMAAEPPGAGQVRQQAVVVLFCFGKGLRTREQVKYL